VEGPIRESPSPTRPELRQPPKRLSARPKRVHIKGVPVKEHSRRTVLSETDGPLTTYDTIGCRKVSNDSSTMDKPTKYFDSARKPWKKTDSGDSSQMAYLTEKLTKLEKKLNKSKKHSKKHVGILPDGYGRTNPLPQIPTKQSVPTSKDSLLGYYGIPIAIPTLRSLIGPAIDRVRIPWLSFHSLTAKSFWREQNLYFMVGTFSIST